MGVNWFNLKSLVQDIEAGAAILAEVQVDQVELDAGNPVPFGPLTIGTRNGKPLKISGNITEG